MNYRRISRSRRYPYMKPEPDVVQDNTNGMEHLDAEIEKSEVENIPMPNENPTPPNSEHIRSHRPMFLIAFRNIHADDIILLGLIFILIQRI